MLKNDVFQGLEVAEVHEVGGVDGLITLDSLLSV
jgi:hypothetical protein